MTPSVATDTAVVPDVASLSLANVSKPSTTKPSAPMTSTPARPLRLCVTTSTHYGQQVRVALAPSPDTALTSVKTLPLAYEPPGVWTITLPSASDTIYYKYQIASDGVDTPVWEAGPIRIVSRAALPTPTSHALVRDVWRPRPDPARDIFSTAAFTRVLFRYRPLVGPNVLAARHASAVSHALVLSPNAYVIVFRVFVERVLPGDEVCLVGDIAELGNGRAEHARVMADTNAPNWEVAVAIPPHVRCINYRFFIRRPASAKGATTDKADPIVKEETPQIEADVLPENPTDFSIVVEDDVRREFSLNDADDRFLEAPPGTAPVVYAPCERAFSFPTKWRGSGIALPVFSIRSQKGCGVGEFNDLIGIVDLCVKMRYNLLQLLPINDTLVYGDFRDSYPYSSISSFALHPQYLNIDSLGEMPTDLRREYESERKRLNAMPTIDITEVMRVKNRFICEMFKIHRDEFLMSTEFTAWFTENQPWLVPYALFRFFLSVNGTAQFDRWGERSVFSMRDLVDFADPGSFHFDHLAVVYYTQYHLHMQLSAAAKHAEENGVVFKGDLPIGVNRYCADTWVNPHLFRLDMQAGAPPDFFSTHGQNWLFPTYNWEAMSKDNYGWWRSRLSHMANYFHAYRIDHILGFFRIWEMPSSCVTGMTGRFYPAVAITRQELESLGLWDIDRYVMPYVTDNVLQRTFHGDWSMVKDRFFEPLYDRLKFKEEFDTERKVEKVLEMGESVSDSERQRNVDIMHKLFGLFSNVCLVRDVSDVNLFHPRFMMETTSSFSELPSDEWRSALYNLQSDYMSVRQSELCRRNGLERLPMMKAASDMLVCGEDLGLVPECVPSVMTETSVLSLAVQRMPAGDAEFGDPSTYSYECVATTSSHDTSTFRGWWEEIPADMRMRYWTELMHRDDHMPPPSQCTPEIAEWAVVDHLRSPAMWAIFPLQDLLALDARLRRADATAERINDPSNPKHVWCFRLHMDIESLLKEKEFIDKISELNRLHGRGAAY